MGTKRRIAGAAAGCAVVLATALGAPSASAQDLGSCGLKDCVGGMPFDQFAKIEDHLLKIGAQLPEGVLERNGNPFLKIRD
jgi:hypothetical protein